MDRPSWKEEKERATQEGPSNGQESHSLEHERALVTCILLVVDCLLARLLMDTIVIAPCLQWIATYIYKQACPLALDFDVHPMMLNLVTSL